MRRLAQGQRPNPNSTQSRANASRGRAVSRGCARELQGSQEQRSEYTIARTNAGSYYEGVPLSRSYVAVAVEGAMEELGEG